jgi:subtilisin family serine protease
MVSSLLQNPGVTYVEPDRIFTVNSGVKSDSTKAKDETGEQGNRSRQLDQLLPWGVGKVGGPIKLNTVPNPDGKIFVLDTGISPFTGDLNIDTVLSLNTRPDKAASMWWDLHGHGTHVAGTIGALNNAIGVVGVVPGASLVAVRVFGVDGTCRTSDQIAGVEHVNINGKKEMLLISALAERY